jgi:aminopeptidase N
MLLSISLFLLAVPLGDLMGPGVSRELALLRARSIRDVRYELSLDVRGADTASGRVVVRFKRRGAGAGDAILDFRGYGVADLTVNGKAAIADFNGAHLRIPARLLKVGENEIALAFRSAIAPSGASIIRFRDLTDGSTYLYTLLVPADANALFPCFDQPDLKARVTLALTTPPSWTAVANGAIASRDSTNAATIWRFDRTAPISTYLVAFAAGPWRQISRASGGKRMTMYVRASRANEAEADSLLETNQRALDWLGEYFGRPYPFGKFDFVLAPAFPFGGMEHPGAVFYNEETFIFRERPTLTQRLGRQATIYHEVAHQWFGDFVTMRWFDDLWLKEGFSTYMAAKMQAAIDPASNAWKTFYLRNKPAAYDVDGTIGTTPVWQELANLDQAKSNYGAIVYNKAPSVLKQLEYQVGERAFQRGVRDFLTSHPYGNATWRELLASVGTAASQPLGAFGEQYILRPGMPLFEQRLTLKDGRIAQLALVQRPVQPSLRGRGTWPARTAVLLVYADGHADTMRVNIQLPTTLVLAAVGLEAPAFVFANVGDHAYGRVLLDQRSVAYLEQHIGGVRDPLLRAMLWGALWDQVRDAKLAPARFLSMVEREMSAEDDEQLLGSMLARLSRTVQAYLADGEHQLREGIERTLALGAADVSRSYGIRKAHLDALVSLAQSPAAVAAIDALLDSTSAAGAPLRAPTRWAIVTALVARGAPTAERRLAEETRRDSTTEGRRRAFVANAAWPREATKQEYFRRYFADKQLNEDWATASLRAFNVPSQERLTRPYLFAALDSLPWIQTNRRIFYLGSWLGAFLDGQRSPEALADVERFLREHPTLAKDLRQKILQNADELERTVRIRAAFGATS